MDTRSLFDRLGGTAGIQALVDDIVALHLENPTIKARFLPFLSRPEHVAQVKRHTVDFFSMGSGGPAKYAGRSMPEAHRGMNISPAEYMAAVDDIMTALRKRNMDTQTQEDVLAIAWGLKGDILHH